MRACLISVVVPTRNRRESLRRLLTALEQQTLSPDEFEVVVCDDGSDDGTSAAVGELASGYAIRVISQSPRGRAAACNAGIRASTADIVLLLDDDMEPLPPLLAAHVAAHEGASPAAILGPVPIAFDTR